jgi:hypothetical protein
MINVMSTAWSIRRKASEKYNVKLMSIVFGICLKMAWEIAKKGEDVESEKIEMPELRGSEKQVCWANDIRQKAYENIFAKADWARVGKAYCEYTDEIRNTIQDYFETETSASSWIEIRDMISDPEQTMQHMIMGVFMTKVDTSKMNMTRRNAKWLFKKSY